MWRASAVAFLLLWCAADGLAQQPASGRPVTKPTSTRQGLQQVTALLERNDLEGARAVLETTIAQQPDSAQAHHLLGVVFDRQNKLAEAVSCYETAVRLDPTLGRGARSSRLRIRPARPYIRRARGIRACGSAGARHVRRAIPPRRDALVDEGPRWCPDGFARSRPASSKPRRGAVLPRSLTETEG